VQTESERIKPKDQSRPGCDYAHELDQPSKPTVQRQTCRVEHLELDRDGNEQQAVREGERAEGMGQVERFPNRG